MGIDCYFLVNDVLPMLNAGFTPMAAVRAEAISGALRDRTFSLTLPAPGRTFLCLLLTGGAARLRTDDARMPLTGPGLLWSPSEPEIQLVLRAGTTGAFVLFGEALLALAVGHNVDSAELSRLARRRITAPLNDAAQVRDECLGALEVIRREQQDPRLGSESLIEGHVRALLVHLWRLATPERVDEAGGAAEASRILQHFRQLLEVNFRARWPIARYAAALGLTTDRLHDICRRSLGKPPKLLVQERQMHEARLMLERSTLTVEQLAAALSFADAAQFSRFFAARAGHPPARYRKLIAERPGTDAGGRLSYADWP